LESIGEVIESSTTEFTTQCRELYSSPALGSLVVSGSTDLVYGVVSHVTTKSLDPGRRPRVMGEEDDTEDDIYSKNPQISRLLCTEFTSISIGYENHGNIYQYMPPYPPKIHALVSKPNSNQINKFVDTFKFVSIMVDSKFPAADETLIAFAREMAACVEEVNDFKISIGREISRLLSADTQRLTNILSRI
jgi:hypothetical protein|tara:strand:+ start:100 stop:672 length:573 start_codon:yes stop_codon:yes gene_type:complete